MPDDPIPCPSPFEDYEFPGEEREGQERAEPITGYRAYLKAWYEWARAQEGGMSYRRFSDLARLRNQPAALRNVILGTETLGPDRLEKFINALELPAAEAEQFRLQVARDQARSDEERALAARRVAAHRRFNDAKRLGRAALSYATRWPRVAIRELVMMKGFREDIAWLVKVLRGKLTPEEVKEAIETLVKSGRLARDQRGRLYTRDQIVTAPSDGSGEHGLAHHREMHALAGDMLAPENDPLAPDSDFKSYTHYDSVTFRLDPDERNELHDYLERVKQEILARFDSAEGRQVMQLNLHLFPLSEVIPETSED